MKKTMWALCALTVMTSVAVTAQAAGDLTLCAGENVTVLVNGQEIHADTTVSQTDKIKLESSDEEAVVVEADGAYYPLGEEFCVDTNVDFSDATALKTGLTMLPGAQVRAGKVNVNSDGKIDALADSGLRFLAEVDYSDTLVADENVEFGIKIEAADSQTAIYVEAEKFQNSDKTLFSVALTNLAESNYNRKFTARAYAKVTLYDGSEKEFTSDEVERSIYQVSVGLMKAGTDEMQSGEYTVNDAVKKVLNAYINQTGIRLTYTSDGKMSERKAGAGSYTGDLFFAVSSTVNPDKSTDVEIVPLNEEDGFNNPVKIESWWKDYVRINNNNSVAREYISDVKTENGVLKFKFKLPEETECEVDNDESVTVVSEITGEYIKGFCCGEEVCYNMADTVELTGRANEMSDIVPGSVVMIGRNSAGECAAIELEATVGMPVSTKVFEKNTGVLTTADGKYSHIAAFLDKKSGLKVTVRDKNGVQTQYTFASSKVKCYRVGVTMEGNTPIISVKENIISAYPSIFENTSKYYNCVYMKYDDETKKVTECVYYCVPKDLDFSGDGEYSQIFGMGERIIVIE